MTVYERIESLRHSRKISQGKLEKELGFSNGSISKWKNSMPTPERLKKVADYFNVSVEYLMTGKEKECIQLKCDGLTGFQAFLADIYGSCEMESVMGKYGACCLYFSVGKGKSRYALTEQDFDRLYNSAKQTIRQMTDLLIRNETIVRHDCQKNADCVPSLEEYKVMRNNGLIFDDLDDLYGFSPILNAAHERTDIEVTDEMQKHDDDIMKNDKLWE